MYEGAKIRGIIFHFDVEIGVIRVSNEKTIIKDEAFNSLVEVNKMTVVKVIELVGSSPKSWEEATKNALAEAAETVRNIKSIDVKRFTAKVSKNKIVEYRSVVKIAFVVKR